MSNTRTCSSLAHPKQNHDFDAAAVRTISTRMLAYLFYGVSTARCILSLMVRSQALRYIDDGSGRRRVLISVLFGGQHEVDEMCGDESSDFRSRVLFRSSEVILMTTCP